MCMLIRYYTHSQGVPVSSPRVDVATAPYCATQPDYSRSATAETGGWSLPDYSASLGLATPESWIWGEDHPEQRRNGRKVQRATASKPSIEAARAAVRTLARARL